MTIVALPQSIVMSVQGQQLIIFRKAGTVSGRHYHKGISPTKDPEIFVLLTGNCTVNWRNINEEEIPVGRADRSCEAGNTYLHLA